MKELYRNWVLKSVHIMGYCFVCSCNDFQVMSVFCLFNFRVIELWGKLSRGKLSVTFKAGAVTAWQSLSGPAQQQTHPTHRLGLCRQMTEELSRLRSLSCAAELPVNSRQPCPKSHKAPALGRLMQEDHEVQATWSYLVSCRLREGRELESWLNYLASQLWTTHTKVLHMMVITSNQS